MPLRRLARLSAAGGWWSWLAGGVAWGLLCVGVRHAALRAGMEMEGLVGERQAALERVQVLERESSAARRLERVEELAAADGFVKPAARQLVIAPPEAAAPAWPGWWGGARAAAAPAVSADAVKIRPREEVLAGALSGPVAPAHQRKKKIRHARPARKHR